MSRLEGLGGGGWTACKEMHGSLHLVSPRSQQPNHDKSLPLIRPDNVCSPVFTCESPRLNILYVKHYTVSRAGQCDTNFDKI